MSITPEGFTDFQAEVSRAFFSLPESSQFRLAGGAALLALELSQRLSRDLDLFTSEGTVENARQAFTAEAERRGWTVRSLRATPTFCQMAVGNAAGVEEVLLDLGVDGVPRRAAVLTSVGTSYDPEELAGQKTLALFGRATERDFVDVYVLAQRFDTDLLLTRAREIDPGFDTDVLAQMIGTIERFTDEELPTDEPAAVRAFFARWNASLRS